MFAFKRISTKVCVIAGLTAFVGIGGGGVSGQTWRQEGRMEARAARQAGRANARTFGFGNPGYTTYYAPGGYYAGPTYYRPLYAGGYYGGPGYYNGGSYYAAPRYGSFVGPRSYNNGPVYGPGTYAAVPSYGPSTAVTPAPRAYLGVIMSETPDGVVVVSEVRPNSPADQAGIQPGDVLMAMNGREIFTPQDVTRRVARHVPGEAVRFDIDRNGQNDRIEAVLGTIASQGTVSAFAPTLAPAYENETPYEVLPAPSQARRGVVEEYDVR